VLKGNPPLTRAEVAAFFAAPPPEAPVQTHQTIDGEHGRIEVWRHAVSHAVDWLFSGRRYPDEPSFPGLAMIGTVERERRHYLSSARLDAETFTRTVRAHWGIENRLHWTLDVVFRDDLARLRTGHGPENMAVVKHMALNLLSQAKPTISLKNGRELAAWNTDYLNQLLHGIA
jgi:hypothetical protein